VSSQNDQRVALERAQVLKAVLPPTLYGDYTFFAKTGRMIKRLQRNRVLWWLLTGLYRCLARYDRLKAKPENTFSTLSKP